jgi:isoleucyl-tRNA synthetase
MFKDFREKKPNEIDKDILEYWEKENVFKKTLEKNSKNPHFVFYEGPPTANGSPHLGHILPRAYKDLFPRYKTMRGYCCYRKGGWDTQGLPVEIEVEKELGLSGKSEIEKYGVEKFNNLCKKSVFAYVKEWNELTKRIGFWIDLEKPYITMDRDYIESVWWLLKHFYSNNLLIKDYKVLPFCPRCGTPLSSHELAQGYKEVEESSIYVKFKIKNQDHTYLLAWTTTPWTLPANVALAVSSTSLYCKIKVKDEVLILAKDRLSIIEGEYCVIDEFMGDLLINTEYEPVFNFLTYDKKAHFVVPAGFVTMEEGTGIVHTAVMYGVDDFNLGSDFDLPKKHAVDLEGKFVPEITPFKGMFVKDSDPLIIDYLLVNNSLYKVEKIKHDYPFCWRCKTPLLYYALESYFIKTTKEKDLIINLNNKINWHPNHLKKGRMGEWLSNMVDWSISRSRYWGTPIPIWRCPDCLNEICVGSFKELEELSRCSDIVNLDPHRPYIDEIKIQCDCGGKMNRIPYVLDCWFDSGAMPFAQDHHPFTTGGVLFPADFICEAIDQTRGWFYTLLAISALYRKESPYKTVLTTGHVLDESGRKMSKSLKNVVDPFVAINQFGADVVRWNFYTGATLGNNFRSGFSNLEEVKRRFFTILINSVSYFITYANISNFKTDKYFFDKVNIKELRIMDRWILNSINKLTNEVTKCLDSFNANFAAKLIESFVIDDLSTWYIRRSKGELTNDVFNTMRYVFIHLAKLLAPFAPFIAEKIYLTLEGNLKSVHLESWPIADERFVNSALEAEMKNARKIVEEVHFIRQKNGIKLRQPLSKAEIFGEIIVLDAEILQIIKQELNIKDILFTKKQKGFKVKLDTNITTDLLLEGRYREIVRSLQDLRKKEGIPFDKKVKGFYPDSDVLKEVVGIYKSQIISQTMLLSLDPSAEYAIKY